MICMLIQGVLFFLLTLGVQLRIWRRLPNCVQRALRLKRKVICEYV